MARDQDLLQLNLFSVGDLLERLLQELFPSTERNVSQLLGAGAADSAETARIFERMHRIEQAMGMLDYSTDSQVVLLGETFNAFFRGVDMTSMQLG